MSSMPSVKYMHVQRALPLTTTNCKRCSVRFSYYRRGRHRYYCEPCKELERQDANDFHNGLTSAMRRAEREGGPRA